MKRIDERIAPATVLPERVLQFGEGNFLRAFIDWMLHRMNESGVFGGSAVVVQPLKRGLVDLLNEQGGLYTLYLRGIQDGQRVNEREVITSISRGLDPYSDWDAYLETAGNPEMRFVVSNTTEAGIHYAPTHFPTTCPDSFPAKLTAWLYRRYELLGASAETGMVFLPCELINRNGARLKDCILRHALDWKLDVPFTQWIEDDCIFLNTLVDRIVPGYPREEATALTAELGYDDPLLCTGEIFHLLVIEGPAELKAELPFHQAGLNVVWTNDLQPYRTRKVGILNGAHTASVLAAYLAGIDTVRAMMEDADLGSYVKALMFNEIVPVLPIPLREAESFAHDVTERFLNPFIQHELLSISLNSVSKWKVRVLPSVKRYVERFGSPPPLLSFSLAALIAFYRGDLRAGYAPNDDASVLALFRTAWASHEEATRTVLKAVDLWGEDLTLIPQFEAYVAEALGDIVAHGARAAVQKRKSPWTR